MQLFLTCGNYVPFSGDRDVPAIRSSARQGREIGIQDLLAKTAVKSRRFCCPRSSGGILHVAQRLLRARPEQGTFALTIDGRGFASHVAAGMDEGFLASECVSCGACVQACPTATLMEKSVIEAGQPEHSVVTTCAYCGVGCSFKAEMKGDQVIRMVPWKDGKANHGHSCVKGRFA